MRKTCLGPVIGCVILGLVCFQRAAAETGTGPRVIRPGPGSVSFAVDANELLELYINLTPLPGDIPEREWCIFAVSSSSQIFLVTEKGIVGYVEGMDLDRATYPYRHEGSAEALALVTMASLGLGPGDRLRYAYGYARPSDDNVILRNIVTLDILGHRAALGSFASAEELLEYLREGLRLRGASGTVPWDIAWGPPVSAADVPADMAFSKTNVQEEGVDEADGVKTDGRFLFVVAKPPPVYYLAAEDEAPGGIPVAEPRSRIRILELLRDPPRTRLIREMTLQEHEREVDALYLVTARGNGRPDLLVTLGGVSPTVWNFWSDLWYWNSGITEVGFYDVSDPRNPVLSNRIRLEGQLVASRRIGDTLYLVTRFTPRPPEFKIYPVTEADVLHNEEILGRTTLDDLLPEVFINGASAGFLVNPEGCHLVPFKDELMAEPTLLTLTAIPLDRPEGMLSKSIVGPSETVYVSPRSLYLATTRFEGRGPVSASGMLVEGPEAPLRPPETTFIHKFELAEDGPWYRASGTVPGHLGWEPDKKPFRMSEYEGTLRVATSLGDTWNETATTRLTLFREQETAEGRLLRETAHLDGIGETGERLYAVRYLGPRCYLITFRVTDPLYVFDLSDPAQPAALGALHLDGYSDYLHPLGDQFLLGIGKEAVPSDTEGDPGGGGAWYQGVKLVLFDVSDPADPREVNAVVIGKRGTESDALYDHHAVSMVSRPESGITRLAIPVQLYDTPPEGPGFDSSKPWAYYDWTHTGLYLFTVHTSPEAGEAPGIERSGEMIVASRFQGSVSTGMFGVDRGVITGDDVHFVHAAMVWSAPWDSPGDLWGPE